MLLGIRARGVNFVGTLAYLRDRDRTRRYTITHQQGVCIRRQRLEIWECVSVSGEIVSCVKGRVKVISAVLPPLPHRVSLAPVLYFYFCESINALIEECGVAGDGVFELLGCHVKVDLL